MSGSHEGQRTAAHRSARVILLLAAVLVLLAAFGGRARASEVITVYRGGSALSVLDEAGARAAGLTVLDLGGAFTPPILRDAPELGERGVQPYAAVYRALADERFADVPDASRAEDERYLELYGIFPTLRVIGARLTDDARHACHAAIDQTPFSSYAKRLWQLPPLRAGKKPSPATLERRAAHKAAVRVVQAHLRCDGLLDKRARDGVFDMWTAESVRMIQRQHMIVSWGIVDEPTRAALLTDSRELDFRSLLRALRERVVAATGIIEDGSASGEVGTVLGRVLDPPELHAMNTYRKLPNGAPDLVSRVTEAAARALGWTSPEAAVAWLRAHPSGFADRMLVALPLPAPPSYHGEHMELRAQIDRGDVWYDFPYEEDGTKKEQSVETRATTTLYAKDGAREIALVRWNTTIGGWQPELAADGTVGLMYKNSDVGPRVWRHVVGAPAWLPPDSTPDTELVKKIDGRPRLNREIVGPGFASAYGLAMMVHEVAWQPPKGGEPLYMDRGVRSHGSVSYRSILRGNSHGCHRLFNHLAIRMASFLVMHRSHTTVGQLPVSYLRTIHTDDISGTIRLSNRGFGYELTPPVPVTVLEGKVKGARKEPIEELMPMPAPASPESPVPPPPLVSPPQSEAQASAAP